MKRYDCFYTNDFGGDYSAFSREDDDGEWISADVGMALRDALQLFMVQAELKCNVQGGYGHLTDAYEAGMKALALADKGER